MIVTLTVDGEPPKRWEWTPDDVRQREAEQIEAKSGVPFEKFNEQVLMGGARARRVLVWHLLRQDHPHLKLDDVDFRVRELQVEPEAAELREWREQLLSSKGNRLTEEQRETMLAAIDTELATMAAKSAQGNEVQEEGKALSVPSESTTA
jgi:hypothetical protein